MHASLCDQLYDLVQNAIEAGASRIDVRWCESGAWHEIAVEDNGCGMSAATCARAVDPFYTDGKKHRGRKVGLGLAFLKQLVEDTGGSWELVSAVGSGTRVYFRLDRSHVDVPPVGDLVATITGLMAFAGDYALAVVRETEAGQYCVSRQELQEALGELETATSLVMMRDYVASQEEAIRKG
jgi:hypothetical protein